MNYLDNDMPKCFIGYDRAESAAFYTLCHSIWRRASRPVHIIPIMLSELKGLMWRDRDPMQSNDFSFSRFLVPYLCNYEGKALFIDADMMVVDDINNLFDLFDDSYSVQCVKHNHVPIEEVKYLGNVQTKYNKKNWSSVLLFNNSKCSALTPEYINTASGLDLHQFKWLDSDSEIGDLPLRWNFLVSYYHDLPIEEISLLHWTEGGAYFNDYKNCPYADIWQDEYKDMIHVTQPASVHYSEVSEKIV